MEAKLKLGSGDGEARMYIDGVEKITQTGLDNDDLYAVLNYVFTGIREQDGALTFPATAYIDDVVVADDYIGCDPNNPSLLGPTNYVDGSWGNDNTPTLEFSQSDPDSGDTVKYRIQIDESSDFSSPVVDYTSAFLSQGATSFTVGQATGSGSYTQGFEGQTLSDGPYYWRIMSEDEYLNQSSWSTANSGDIAFRIDITPPSGGSITYTDGYYTTTSVSLTVDDGTDSGSGINTSTRQIQRKEATLSADSCGTFGAWSDISPSGTYPNFTDSTVVTEKCYQYQYLVSDNVSNQATYTSTNVAKIDTTEPSCQVSSVAESSVYSYVLNSTIYYNSASSGSFTVNATAENGEIGIQKVTFPETVSAGGDDTTLPYSWDYNWDISDIFSQATNITCYNNAGSSQASSFTISRDTVAPSGGSISYPDGYYLSNSVDLTVSDGTDSGAGVDTPTRIIQRKEAVLSEGGCDSFGSWANISPIGTYPNFTDTIIQKSKCYQYQYKISDNVSNQATYTLSNIIKTPYYTEDYTEEGKIYKSVKNTALSSGIVYYSGGPESGDLINLSVIPSFGQVEVTIEVWQVSGNYYKKWKENASDPGIVADHTVGDLKANTNYDILVGGGLFNILKSDNLGQIYFVYDGGYSEKTFEVETSEGGEIPETGTNLSHLLLISFFISLLIFISSKLILKNKESSLPG